MVNASISGETTEGGAARIRSALESFQPALVILELGGNDGLRGFPPARMKANLEKIVRTSIDSGAAVVLLGIHPNAAAQPVLLDNAWPIINEALADESVINSG